MTPAVTIKQRDGLTILALEGPAGPTLFSTLQASVVPACPSEPVVFDITALTITGPDALRQLVAFLHWSASTLTRVGLVCRRLSARRLLHRSGATEAVPVFMTIEEALAAFAPLTSPAALAGDRPSAGDGSTGRSRWSSAGRPAKARAQAARRYAAPMGGEV